VTQTNSPSESLPRSPENFEQAFREIGDTYYYDTHPFHVMLNDGQLSRGQLQAWVLNRYCFQNAVARKDAALISRMEDFELRREWSLRLLDHDGFGDDIGGIGRWMILSDALGLDRDYVRSKAGALPVTLFAVEGYVRFATSNSLVLGIASSLTELMSPRLHRDRLGAMIANYSFLDAEALTYFKRRLTHAPRDASFALEFVKRSVTTRQQQDECLQAFQYKCQMLWTMLDGLHHAYVEGYIPPGAFQPGIGIGEPSETKGGARAHS
jgi:pyrroloquinoline-quinone synthase